MAVAITDAGSSLIARLQSEGRPLVIDRFIFAYVPGLDPTQPIDTTATVPENIVYSADIPEEFRAYVNPNQVVYSVMLGSETGDFTFNWQGIYCSEHATLVAVATFPSLLKRAYDTATLTPGNNFTRNFLLSFSGARELTQIVVEAKVWQLDFSVRLRGIDERERLSNRDIYGRSAFWDDAWRLTLSGASYSFFPGPGYIEGVRAALEALMPVVPSTYPCNVWLDVCMEPQGSDVITTIAPRFLAPDVVPADYTTPAPDNIRHFVEKVAYIAAEGAEPEDLRRTISGGLVANLLKPIPRHARDYFYGQI